MLLRKPLMVCLGLVWCITVTGGKKKRKIQQDWKVGGGLLQGSIAFAQISPQSGGWAYTRYWAYTR